jgi:hypothetical protein
MYLEGGELLEERCFPPAQLSAELRCEEFYLSLNCALLGFFGGILVDTARPLSV